MVNADKRYFPQVFLKKCKYATKEIKAMNTINENLTLNESEDESDNDESNESDEYQSICEQWQQALSN